MNENVTQDGIDDDAVAPVSAETPDVTNTSTDTEQPKDSGGADWRASVTKGDLSTQAERYTSIDALVQSTIDMRRKMSTSVNIPGKDSSDQDRADFNEKMGVPKSTEDYKINLPQELDASLRPDDAGMADLRGSLEGMRAAGASQSVIDAGLQLHFGVMQSQRAAQIEADQAFSKESMVILEKKWGADYEDNKKIAASSAEQLFGDNFEAMRSLETSDGRFILDHPHVMEMLANIGREMGDSHLGGVVSTDQRMSIDQQADDFRDKAREALAKGNSQLAAEYDRKEREVLAKLG